MNVQHTIDQGKRQALHFVDPQAGASCTVDINDTNQTPSRTLNVDTGRESGRVLLQLQPEGLSIAIDYNEQTVYEGPLSKLAFDLTPIDAGLLNKVENRAIDSGVSLAHYLTRLIEADLSVAQNRPDRRTAPVTAG